MSNRILLLALASVGLVGVTSIRSFAATPMPVHHAAELAADDDKKEVDEKEEKIAVDQLPAAVVATVKKELPDGKITDAEKEQKDGKTVYEIDAKSGDTTYEIKTSDDGTLISKKVEDDKEGHEEHGDKKYGLAHIRWALDVIRSGCRLERFGADVA